MKILIINGPNLNLLNYRNSNIYGALSYEELVASLYNLGHKYNFDLEIEQSNSESKIINLIHKAILNNYQAIIINPAAYTHYSYAIHDALEIFSGLKIEVHLSNIYQRENFRQINVIKDVVDYSFYGKKELSYYEALEFLSNKLIK